jgi:hypothetical protein
VDEFDLHDGQSCWSNACELGRRNVCCGPEALTIGLDTNLLPETRSFVTVHAGCRMTEAIGVMALPLESLSWT